MAVLEDIESTDQHKADSPPCSSSTLSSGSHHSSPQLNEIQIPITSKPLPQSLSLPPPCSFTHSSGSHHSSPQHYEIQIPTTEQLPPPQALNLPPLSSPPAYGSIGHSNRALDGINIEDGSAGGGKRKLRPEFSMLKRVKSENVMKKGLLGFRVFGFLFCLVSFSVMAADRDQGWALDSFYRYKEFRYCMALNVICFLYSGVQGVDLAYQLATGKLRAINSYRYQIDFLIDQSYAYSVIYEESMWGKSEYFRPLFLIHFSLRFSEMMLFYIRHLFPAQCLWKTLTYLLLSASSSAAVRVDDWQSNWGKDKFPQMATASVSLSFLAFVAFALSSLVSGYFLFTMKSR
ncbi:hypothetical protein ACFE04_010147 [Oxalis oulophora]